VCVCVCTHTNTHTRTHTHTHTHTHAFLHMKNGEPQSRKKISQAAINIFTIT